jgi:hypothetical protein
MTIRLDNGEWTTIPMQEGVNQGCPLSSTLAVIVLHSILVPLAKNSMIMLNNSKTALTMLLMNKAVKPTPATSIVTHHEDLLFFLQEFEQLATPLGCALNPTKTHILTSTDNTSAIPAICCEYGNNIANQVEQDIQLYSISSDDTPTEVRSGICLLIQPIGSE